MQRAIHDESSGATGCQG